MPPRPEIPLPERRRMGEPRPLAPRPEAPPPEARPEAPPERRRPLEEWSYPELQAHAKKLGIPARQKKPELIKSIKKETYQQRDKALSDFVEDAFGKKLYEVPIERIGPELERRGVKVSHEMGWRLMASQRRAILQARREGKKVPPEVLGPHGIKEKLTEAEQKELERAKKLTEGFFHPFGKPAKGKKTGPSEWEPIPGTIMERRKLRGKGASQYIEEGGLYRMRNPLWNRRPRQPQYITVRAERKLEGIKWEGTNLATGRKIRFSIHRIQDQVRQREKAPEAGPQASLGVEGEPGGLRGAVEAAPKVFPKGRQEKRYISDVWEAYRKQTGEDISLPEFKRMLWAEHAKGKEGTVRLSRADLVEAMEATKVKASEFQASPTARFHLVELREPVPGLRLPRKGEGREGGFLDLEAIRQTISKGAKMPARMISDLAQHVVNTLGAAARSFDSVYSFLRRTFGEKVSRYARDIWDAVTARLSTIVRRKYRAPEPHLDPRQPKLSEPVVQKVVDDRYQTSYVEWMRGVGDWFKDLLKTQGPLGEELVAKFSEAVRIRYLFEGYLWNPKGPNIGKVLRVTGRPFMTSGMMGPKRKDGFLAFSRFHDLMEGRAKPANNRELAVYTPYRNLLDQTWDAMRAMGLKRYNHRTGEMEPLPPRPKGGDILPAKFSPEFFEVLRTIDSSHALAQRLTREIARVNQKAGYEHINQKYVEGWYERFREAIDTTNVKPGRSVKQINAEFMREIPILPSYMQWGKMAGFRRWIPILESNPFYYAQQYGRQAAARMGFIKAFGEDIKLGELRKQFGQEGGNQKRFDQAMRAVQELPIYIAKFDPEARMLLKPITNAWKGIVDLYRTRMLSRATVAVAAETGFGPTTVFFGITPQAKAAGRRAVNAIANLIRKDRKSAIETLNSLGVGIDLLPNYSFNPRAPWTSLTRMVSDFVQRNIILFTRASIAHERHVGLSAREYIDQIMRYAPGKKVPAWLKPYKLFRSVFNIDLTALKNLGFSLDEAMRIRKGEVSMSDLQRATQNAAAAMTGGRRPSLHDSPFGKNPYSRFFFFFTDYARVRIRQLMVVSRSVSDAYRIAKSNQYTKLQKLDAMRNAGMSFARFFGYSTLQGFSYMFAAAALRGGPGDEEDGPWPGVDILLSDAKDRPFHNIMMANFYAGVLGPFGSLVYFSATDHPLVSAAKVTGPGSIVVEAIEFAEGWGSYRDQELLERAATMFERRTPIGPLATTWAAVLGIGSKNAALEEAWSARWRYFYDAGLIKPGYMTTRGAKADEEHARFRMEMRRAANALRSEQYDLADEYLIRAIGHKLETPRSVRDSLLMKRALWNFETRLTPEQEEGLRKRIGEQAYLQLLHWDTVIEAFARAYSGL